jgi:hypothetical protein
MSDVETPTGQLTVFVDYTSATAGNGAIAGPLTGATSFAWTPSGLDAPDVQITVRVVDGDGASRTAQAPQIQVDSTAPTKTTTPQDGATGVSKTAAITIVFNEGMNQVAVRNGFSILPIVGNLQFSWSVNTLTVTHDPFAAATPYVVTLSGATDDCDPGLPLAAPTSFGFTTASNQLPTASITTPAAGAQFAPGSTITITWTMSDAPGETPTANLVVFLNYTSSAGDGRISARLVGATSYAWTAPNIDSSNVKVVLTVIDQDGGPQTVESGAFAIKSAGLDLITIGGLLGIILAVIIGALLYFLVFAKRRKKEEEAPPPPAAPMRAAPPPRAAAPPAARAPPPRPPAPAPPSGGMKECPGCGTIIDAKDNECFMCGHKF